MSDDNSFELEVNALINLAGQIQHSQGEKQQRLTRKYLRLLNETILGGWTYALGKEHEIDEALLPHRYLNQRNRVIENLQIELGDCAANYRAAPVDDKETISKYHKVFAELKRICGKIIGLDPDSELPDEDMPQEYVEYWNDYNC